MSGNGDNVKHTGFNVGVGYVPPGNGGGCVTTGPFKKYIIPLRLFNTELTQVKHDNKPWSLKSDNGYIAQNTKKPSV